MAPPSHSSDLERLYDHNTSALKSSKVFLEGPATLTYGQLFDRIERLAALFQRQGLAIGDRAVIASDQDEAVAVLFLALVRCGLTAIPISPQSTALEIKNIIKATQPKMLFADGDILQRAELDPAADAAMAVVRIAKEDGGGVFDRLRLGRARKQTEEQTYPALLKALAPAGSLPRDIPEATVAYILFTSGTTSRPKGVEITHGNLFSQMATFVRHYGFSDKANLLNILPLYHTDGLTQGVVVAFCAGASLYRPLRFRMERLRELLDTIYAKRITHWVTVPAVLSLVVNFEDEFAEAFDTPDFRFVISTAAYLDENIWRRFEAAFQVPVVNVFGLTETVCESLYCGPDDETRRVGSVGKPIDSEARIVDGEGAEVAQGDIGELILRGAHIMKGYLNMPEETAQVLRDGWFHTGDLARVDEDGFYFIVGRKKNMVVSAGINVYPEEVTSILRQVPGVLDAVTLGIEDQTWGEKVVSCVELAPGSAVTSAEIGEAFLQRASPDLQPRDIRIVEALPRGPAGKVKTEEVRQLFTTVSVAGPAEAAGDLESQVLATAAKIFNVPPDSLGLESDSANTSAWTSLAHVEFILALEERFKIRMSPREVMGIKSLRDAIMIVESRAVPPAPSGAAAAPDGGTGARP